MMRVIMVSVDFLFASTDLCTLYDFFKYVDHGDCNGSDCVVDRQINLEIPQ
jgi:hypothetical protein